MVENDLLRHYTIIDSKLNPHQNLVSMHKNAVLIALNNHKNLTFQKIPNYQQAQRIVYHL